MGIEEDLEDLRSELVDDLQEYEGRIRDASGEPPDWTGLSGSHLRAPFDVTDEGLPEAGRIGPRLVAVVAGRVESFVLEWLPPVGESEELEFDRETLDRFENDLDEFLTSLVGIERIIEQAAPRAHTLLDELWEYALASLDERRETDIGALEDLVHEGALDTGPDARAERANLWEEQRQKADRLRDRWEALHELVDEGHDYAVEGLEELESMVERACQGLEGAYPELAEKTIIERCFEAADEARESAEGSNTEPLYEAAGEASEESGDTNDEDADVAEEDSGETDVGQRDTAPASESYDQWLRKSSEVEEVEEVEQETVELDEGPTSDDESDVAAAQTAPADGMAPTRPVDIDASAADPGEMPTAPMIDEKSESEELEELPEESEESSGEHEESSEVSEEGGRADDVGDSGERPTESDAPERVPEPVTAQCIRIRTDWAPVSGAELAAALGPPVGFLLFIVGVSVAHLAGVEAAFNPIATWPWATAAVAVAVAWCFVAPLLLQWRPTWSGWHFQFIREAEIRDDTELVIDPERFAIDRISFRWDAVKRHRIKRWESEHDEMIGWLLVVEPAYHEAIRVIAPEYNDNSWKKSAKPVVEPPSDAWQIEPSAFERLEQFLERM